MSKCSGDQEEDTQPVTSTAGANTETVNAQLNVSVEQYRCVASASELIFYRNRLIKLNLIIFVQYISALKRLYSHHAGAKHS